MGPGRFLAQLFHRFLVYNFSPAGWFFFAGGSHFVGIFGPNFWYHFWSQFLAPGCPQIQGLLFNLKFLVPVLGTRFGPQTWDQKPYSFLFQTPVTFQPNFEQSLHLTQKMGTKSVLVLGTCVHPKRCRVVLIFGTRSVFGPTFSQVFGLQFFAGWLVFFCWRVAFCGHFWSQFLVPFLVPVFGTGLPPNTRIVIQPQISGPSFGHPFWSPNLGPKTVQFSVPNSGHISTQF